jgi:hypothetical protein
MRRVAGRAVLIVALCGAILAAAPRPQTPVATDTFASWIAALSEPGGYFDTDDLISNERSYLHVMPALRQAALAGTAYIGVGPDTNFSYIAATRPSVAFIIDIRRDNLLLHLLFKALFAESETRLDYLARLLGREHPAATALGPWRTADIAHLVTELEREPAVQEAGLRESRTALERRLKTFGVPLSAEDLATIDRFHRTFETQGLQLRLEIINRGAPSFYPTLSDLLLETDRDGRPSSFCASEDDFQFVRGLEAKDLVIPVVGDLGGTTALRNIGRMMTARGVTLGAFYTSNVEFYLFRSGTFRQFVTNVSNLPRTPKSVIVRSAFVSAVGNYVPMLPGYVSASLVGSANDLVDRTAAGRIQGYLDLVVR